MDGLDGDHMVPPTVMSHNNRKAVFSVHGQCRRFITDMAYAYLDSGCGDCEIGRLTSAVNAV
jgi:hypothetical protein